MSPIFLSQICLILLVSSTPQPGEVYREYVKDIGGQIWRVTDPECEVERSHKFLPNPVHHITVDDLDGAIKF